MAVFFFKHNENHEITHNKYTVSMFFQILLSSNSAVSHAEGFYAPYPKQDKSKVQSILMLFCCFSINAKYPT